MTVTRPLQHRLTLPKAPLLRLTSSGEIGPSYNEPLYSPMVRDINKTVGQIEGQDIDSWTDLKTEIDRESGVQEGNVFREIMLSYEMRKLFLCLTTTTLKKNGRMCFPSLSLWLSSLSSPSVHTV